MKSYECHKAQGQEGGEIIVQGDSQRSQSPYGNPKNQEASTVNVPKRHREGSEKKGAEGIS